MCMSAMIIFEFRKVQGRRLQCFRLCCHTNLHRERVEVAFFNSRVPDASGAGDGVRKGKTPKEEIS